MNEVEPTAEGPLIPEAKAFRERELAALARIARAVDGRGGEAFAQSFGEDSLIPRSVELTRRRVELVERIAAGVEAVARAQGTSFEETVAIAVEAALRARFASRARPEREASNG